MEYGPRSGLRFITILLSSLMVAAIRAYWESTAKAQWVALVSLFMDTRATFFLLKSEQLVGELSYLRKGVYRNESTGIFEYLQTSQRIVMCRSLSVT